MKPFSKSFGDVGSESSKPPQSTHRVALRIFWAVTGAVMAAALLPAVVPAAAKVAAPSISTAPSAYTAVTPVRLMDTRNAGGPLGPQVSRNLTVAGVTPGAPAGATAVVLNVTVANTTAASFLTVYPAGDARPLASNLNWKTGNVIPNLVEVPTGTGGAITIYNQWGSTDVVVDLEGYFTTPSGTAGGEVALTPYRITDTRAGSGQANAGSTLGAQGSLDIQVTGTGGSAGVPASGVSGAILNVTSTNGTAASFLTVWPQGAARPLASNLNWNAGQTIPNRVFVPVSASGKVSVYNQWGSTDVVVDVSGYFTNATATGAPFTAQSPVRLADTRNSGQTVGSGGVFTLPIGGVSVPASATAVILNVTVTNTNAASFLTVYPSTSTRPLASDLNWTAGVTIPNLTVATLGTSGAVSFYNSAGSTDVVVDLFGYFGAVPGFSGVTVTATPSSVPANGTATSSVVATVKNNGAVVAGDAVSFTKAASATGSCGNLAPTTGVTNALGQVTVTYTASTTVGTCTITATEANNSRSGTAVITQTTPPNTVTIAPATASVPATGSSTQNLTITVLNYLGVAVSGDTVNMTTSGTCGSVAPTAGTTNSAGQLTAVYISSTSTGFCTVTATETGTGASGTSVITQTTSPAPANGPYTVAAVTFVPATLPADGTSTAVASTTVRNTVPAPVSGDLVRFSKAAGASCTGVLLNGGSSAVVSTNSSGVASVTYTAGTTVGTCVITATEATFGVSNTGGEPQTAVQNTVTVSASPSTISNTTSSTSVVTATVTGPSGAASVGSHVTFTGVGTPAGACGGFTGSPATTNSSGQAAVVYTASTTAGYCTVTATDDGTGTPTGAAGGSGTTIITQTSASGYTTTGAATPASIPADGASTSTVTATVKDSGGVAVSGDTVTFTKGATVCTAGTQTAVTNASGVATITYTASLTVGTCTITAHDQNGGSTATITVTQTAPKNVVTLAPGAVTLAANGTSSQTFTATVTSFGGTPVVGDTVTFTTSGSPAAACGPMSVTSGTTNASGQIASVYVSSGTSGFCTITAADNGTGTPAGPGSSAKSVVTQTTSPAPASTPYTVANVTFAPNTLPADGTSTATASTTVMNAVPAAVAGDTVRFTLNPIAAGNDCTGALLNGGSSATAVTNASGVASVTFTAGTVVGTCHVTATEASTGVANALGGEPQTAVPNTITASANPSTLTANGTSTSQISILVTNSAGPVSGDVLTIAKVGTPAAACGTLTNTATTSSTGTATVVYISSTTSGFCNITITDGSGGSGTVQITQQP